MKLQTDLFVDPPFGDFTGGRLPEEDEITRFQDIIYSHYRENGRSFPWRETTDPYEILVSEIMLQQTQTERVLDKYRLFLESWPDFQSLAAAGLTEVIRAWSGLGYNRRAKGLLEIARTVVERFDGSLPDGVEQLRGLPMVGHATASAVMAFAFGKGVPYLETNIRRVFIYFFFDGRDQVRDRELMPLVEITLDNGDPRQWYYALMDYGVMLRKILPNPNRRSAHYTRQSAFEGSDRQIRGAVLKYLSGSGESDSAASAVRPLGHEWSDAVAGAAVSLETISKELPYERERLENSLKALVSEGFLVYENGRYRLGD